MRGRETEDGVQQQRIIVVIRYRIVYVAFLTVTFILRTTVAVNNNFGNQLYCFCLFFFSTSYCQELQGAFILYLSYLLYYIHSFC